jgi:hypothetical protein
MIVEEMKIGNAKIYIHDDFVDKDKEKEILERISIVTFNHQRQESR